MNNVQIHVLVLVDLILNVMCNFICHVVLAWLAIMENHFRAAVKIFPVRLLSKN